jgi:hypothetical protein
MQSFGAVFVVVVAAAFGNAGPRDVVRADAVTAPVGEAYVAELDSDWNVTREIRVACPTEAGCTVDLPLTDPALAAVHVRFAAPQAGTVAVTSRLEDRSGRASAQEAESLSLDHAGFGAFHYAAAMTGADSAGRTIMMAVKIPGWTAPEAVGVPHGADRT